MSRKNLFALVPVGLVVIICLFVATRSEVRDPQGAESDVTISNAVPASNALPASSALPARLAQEVRSDSLEQRAIRSPSGRHVVYYGPYDPYKAKPDCPLFTVVDTAEKTDVQVAVEWPARYVSSVYWIDDHFVLAKGEGVFLAIIDVASGRQTHSLIGKNFSVAPNSAALVYRFDFNPIRGEISPYSQSDYVLLTYLGDSRGRPSPADNYRVVYPEYFDWGRAAGKLYPEPDTRHQFVSTFAWSADSKKVAFAENNEQAMWITVLTFNPLDDSRPIATRLKLDEEKGKTANLSWLSSSTIRVMSDSGNWIVDIDAGSVVPQS
jgi:hypothetical protein